MNKRNVVIIASAFLLLLFLSTIGSFYTGYAVLDQEDITLKFYPYPFIKNNVANSMYIVVPYHADQDHYRTARLLATSLKLHHELSSQIITDKEVPEGIHNLILLGNPCTNEFIAKELATDQCDLGLEENEGSLQLINHQRSSTLIVSGNNVEGMMKAAHVLTYYRFYHLFGNKITVSGKEDNLVLNYL